MWRAVVFDVGGVLAHQNAVAADDMLRRVSPLLSVESLAAALVRPATYPIWEKYSCGRVDGGHYWAAVLRDMGLEGTPEQVGRVREIQASTWWAVLDQKVMMQVAQLKERHDVRLGILSNSSPEHEPFIPSLDGRFDVLRFSHRTGLRKPWPRAYTATAEELAVSPAEMVFVDDRARNLEAASDLGIRALRFRGAEELEHQLAELELPLRHKECR